jgi:hypothetical protein
MRLLAILTGDEDEYLKKGTLEVNELAEELSGPAKAAEPAGNATTIGSLKN